MYPKYLDGDTVIVQLQPDCESGQDCACYVNGYNATLKTVFNFLLVRILPSSISGR